jgi:hypothetical protein
MFQIAERIVSLLDHSMSFQAFIGALVTAFTDRRF